MEKIFKTTINDRMDMASKGTVCFQNKDDIEKLNIHLKTQSNGNLHCSDACEVIVFDSFESYLSHKQDEKRQTALNKLTNDEKILLGLT